MTMSLHLPVPVQRGAKSLEETIAKRRSVRNFTAGSISMLQLSQVLWAAQGVTDASWGLRSVPSAGATYPLELLVACGGGVDGLEEGLYRYRAEEHSLIKLLENDIRKALSQASLNQDFICRAQAVIVICAVTARTAGRYGARAERYIHIEVGHAGQNIYLEAEALGLGTVAIGAFNDEKVRQVIGLDNQYLPLYIMPLGKPA